MVYNSANKICPYCDASEKNLKEMYAREKLNKEKSIWINIDSLIDDCPPYCCQDDTTECPRQMGNHGTTVPIDKEYMLIFGGMTAREKYFNDTENNTYDIYNYCERLTELTADNVDAANISMALKTCGEELLSDVWIYNVLSGDWTFLKPDMNKELYMWARIPYARYGHSGSYVELNETDVTYNLKQPLL